VGFVCVAVVALAIASTGCAIDVEDDGEDVVAISLTSTAFRDGEDIPPAYTCDGSDVSPELAWGAPPDGTMSLALICDDPDAPRRFTHWVLFNMPADMEGLAKGVPVSGELEAGAVQGTNDFGDIGYGGPCPPVGPPHHYYFALYALDVSMDLSPGASKKQLLDAMEGHVLAEGQLVGLYQR